MNLEEVFRSVFNEKPEHEFFAPGRINLIGEHIDYNGGNVFPCAITYGTTALVRKRNDRKVRFYSQNFIDEGIIERSLDALEFNEADDWANYTKGTICMFEERGYKLDTGFDVLYHGNIPNGAGLSSSASLSVATSIMIANLYNFDVSKLDIVYITQDVENKYMGVNTGIMDQFAITFGKREHAILLNTDNVEYEYVPVELGNHSIIIMNTNKRRGLTDSKYNERRSECEDALKIIQEHKDVQHLCDLSVEQLEELKQFFNNDTIYRRAFHAVSENERTQAAKRVLSKGDLFSFGMLMNASHNSLRDDYEVTGIELDTLVEKAWTMKSCLGARVTGAGFGGCAIAIVHNNSIDEFIEEVGTHYKEKIGYAADFYTASVGEGAHQVK